MNTNEIIDAYDKHVMHTYGRQPIVLDYGKGAIVYDTNGKKYLDFFAGVAVNNLGQCHPKIVKTIKKQAEKMLHCSNVYYNEPGAKLAIKLAEFSDHNKVFFANSGAEANEGAIKLARKFKGKGEIITANNSFHGRTLVTVTATGQEKYQIPFKPLPPGFKHVDFGDINQMKEAISDETCAIMLEVVQGEGGINVATEEYMKDIEALCMEKDILLIIDEVQTGFGRCGEIFAYKLYGIKPDIITIAKGFGGGVPIGAVLATDKVADAFKPGDHGSTFGGNPFICEVANKACDVLIEEKLIENSKEMGNYLKVKFNELKDSYDFIVDVRGHGLMLGVELSLNGGEVVDKMREKGFLINCTADTVLRFVPPLIINKEQINKMIIALDEVFTDISL